MTATSTAAPAPAMTHSKFFNQQRPTATEFEKANDLMEQLARETNMQLIWSLTDPTAQTAAVKSFLALFPGMSKQDIKDETNKALTHLDPKKTTPSAKLGKPAVWTAATGAAFQVCETVNAGNAATVAVKGQEKALETACATMKPVMDARKARIPDTTNIEIIAR